MWIFVCSHVRLFVLLLSYSITAGALESPSLLPSYSIRKRTISLHITIIIIITNPYIFLSIYIYVFLHLYIYNTSTMLTGLAHHKLNYAHEPPKMKDGQSCGGEGDALLDAGKSSQVKSNSLFIQELVCLFLYTVGILCYAKWCIGQLWCSSIISC